MTDVERRRALMPGTRRIIRVLRFPRGRELVPAGSVRMALPGDEIGTLLPSMADGGTIAVYDPDADKIALLRVVTLDLDQEFTDGG